MKIVFILFFSILTMHSYSQCDTTFSMSHKDSVIKKFILSLNYRNYKGNTIGQVIKKKYIRDFCSKSYIQKIVGLLSGLDLSYKGFVKLRLFISAKDSQKFKGQAASWDFDKLQKCSILRIEVVDLSNLELC